MTIKVKILADSVTQEDVRLTTFELKYPRFIHPQVMSHREFSRNVQSSRAIPTSRIIKNILDDPATPMKWGINKKGMEASEYVTDANMVDELTKEWLRGLEDSIARIGQFEVLSGEKIHKQTVNRLLEPWMHVKTILSSTSFTNFFHLRISKHAQPEIRLLAEAMRDALDGSTMEEMSLELAHWHLPLISDEDRAQFDINDLKKISVGRCARVSYLTHEGKRDPKLDIQLHDRLAEDGHWSPFEHVATPTAYAGMSNFFDWHQYRKDFEHEYVY